MTAEEEVLAAFFPDQYRAMQNQKKPYEVAMENYPNYVNPWNESMAMGPGLADRLSGINMDKRGLERFRQEALRKGPSAWSSLSKRNQASGEMTARERAVKDVAGQSAMQRSNLAMRGGLRSGARERMARQGQKDYLAMSQDIGRQGDMNRLQIDMNDETNRIQQLGMLPGMEVAALQPEFQKTQLWGQGHQFDTGNRMAGAKGQNDYNQKKFSDYMTYLGAERQAQATERAGGGSWLCTEANLREQLSVEDLRSLGEFLRFARVKDKKSTHFYLGKGAELVRRMKEAGYDWDLNTRFIRDVVSAVQVRDLNLAWDIYTSHVYKLMNTYWPDCTAEAYLLQRQARSNLKEGA